MIWHWHFNNEIVKGTTDVEKLVKIKTGVEQEWEVKLNRMHKEGSTAK